MIQKIRKARGPKNNTKQAPFCFKSWMLICFPHSNDIFWIRLISEANIRPMNRINNEREIEYNASQSKHNSSMLINQNAIDILH